jgi:hypothetical protein
MQINRGGCMDIEEMRRLFYFVDGILYRKVSASKNTKKGGVAGYLASSGYWITRVKNKAIGNHRIIFAIHHGYLPKFIDHKDRNKANNRIENLREATAGQNQRNRGLQKNNTSGIKGVSWDKRVNKWIASGCTNSKQKKLGYFDNICDARDAVENYRDVYHREFASHDQCDIM